MSKKMRKWFRDVRVLSQEQDLIKPVSDDETGFHFLSRREFLKAGAMLSAGTATSLAAPLRGAAAPRIVVVGAGLAGMTAAYRIWKSTGNRPLVFEANDRIGGRTSTVRNLPGGQWAERGGQSVSTNEKHIRSLLSELEIPLIDTDPSYPDGYTVYRFGGRNVSRSEVNSGLNQANAVAEAHFEQVRYVAGYNNKDERTIYFDRMSAAEWISRYCPGGLESVTGQAMKVNFENDYAGRIEDASALTLIYDMAAPGGGGYDERYIISGGSDRAVSRMAELLPAGSIQTGKALVALRPNSDGSVRLTFQQDGSAGDVTADHVVLALPFTILRQADCSRMGFEPLMRTAIQEMGIGINAKLHFQFNKPYYTGGRSGDSASDLTTGLTWPGNLGHPGAQSLLVIMNSSAFAKQYTNMNYNGPIPQPVIDTHMAAIQNLFPGSSSSFNGWTDMNAWAFCPWTRGSYSCYLAGQFSKFGGIEAKTQGRVHFAGEHTALFELRGTMNGAVQSGERAASQVIDRLA